MQTSLALCPEAVAEPGHRCDADEVLRLLGLLGGLSAATDLGAGAPLEESLRRAILSVRLARALGSPADEVRDVLYTGLLQHLGCTAFSHEIAGRLGDDLSAIRAAFVTDWSDRRDLLRTFVPLVAAGSGRSRARTLVEVVTRAEAIDRAAPVATCEIAAHAARRLGLPDPVQAGLAHVTCRWDGAGHPGVAGEEIPFVTRVMHVASVATLFCLLDGPDRAAEEVRRRAGEQLDPAIARALTVEHLADLAELDGQATLLGCEPDPPRLVDWSDATEVARTFGDIADLKSPWLHGHSGGVADLAADAAGRLGLDTDEIAAVRVAGHLHDVGRMGVSSRIWDKSGRLSAAERAQLELHPWHTDRVLAGVPALTGVARIAREHHERLDGSGYHRQAVAAQLSLPSRTLAAADWFRPLREDRPHRRAADEADAAAALRRDAADGRLDPDAVAAVLAAAGAPATGGRVNPAGLTERQVAVLRLLAAGHSNREIADALVISRRTAEHHVQDVYARIGVSSRAAAALFAMEHGLLSGSG